MVSKRRTKLTNKIGGGREGEGGRKRKRARTSRDIITRKLVRAAPKKTTAAICLQKGCQLTEWHRADPRYQRLAHRWPCNNLAPTVRSRLQLLYGTRTPTYTRALSYFASRQQARPLHFDHGNGARIVLSQFRCASRAGPIVKTISAGRVDCLAEKQSDGQIDGFSTSALRRNMARRSGLDWSRFKAFEFSLLAHWVDSTRRRSNANEVGMYFNLRLGSGLQRGLTGLRCPSDSTNENKRRNRKVRFESDIECIDNSFTRFEVTIPNRLTTEVEVKFYFPAQQNLSAFGQSICFRGLLSSITLLLVCVRLDQFDLWLPERD